MSRLFWCFDCDYYGNMRYRWLHNLMPWHRWRVRRAKTQQATNDLGEGKS